ncbi:hypothetical protein RIF29_37453 [Crotalaria pallida]|uniref:Uncharacterized protein n=1 Tax=Crotalaria pallida TaxID=3830 RepID=A0AAN9ECH3_CROPI
MGKGSPYKSKISVMAASLYEGWYKASPTSFSIYHHHPPLPLPSTLIHFLSHPSIKAVSTGFYGGNESSYVPPYNIRKPKPEVEV